MEWAVGIEQFVEAAYLDYSSGLKHVDALRLAYCGQPMGDHDTSRGETLDTLHDLGLALGIEPACSLIEKYYPWIAHQGRRNPDSLNLPT